MRRGAIPLRIRRKMLTPLVATKPDVFAYYFVALHTGCRIGELMRLRVQDVDLILKRLFIGGRTKNKRSRYVPMSEDLAVFLKGLVEGRNWMIPCCLAAAMDTSATTSTSW